jgi:hypothetical protein
MVSLLLKFDLATKFTNEITITDWKVFTQVPVKMHMTLSFSCPEPRNTIKTSALVNLTSLPFEGESKAIPVIGRGGQ